MAEDYPEIFSAVSTMSAWTGELTAVTNPEWNSANPLLRLRNLSSLPIRLIHGDADFHSPSPQATPFYAGSAKGGGHPRNTCGFLATVNSVWSEPQRAMFEFFATLDGREPAIPQHVTLAVTEAEHNHAFWIQVDQLRTTDTPGYVTGQIHGRNRISITSTNIRKVTINTRRLPHRRAGRRPWVIVCNGGTKQRVVPDQSEQIVLNVSQGGVSVQ